MGIADDIKGMLVIKKKPRHDGLSDQFSRIFLMRICMVATLFVGMNWYSDSITCIINKDIQAIDPGFVKQACWINGLYVYEKFGVHDGTIGYYGIPRELATDGMTEGNEMCTTQDKQSGLKNIGCNPMKKTFFLQYQYLVFYVSILAIFYYAPYLIWKIVNTDIMSLKTDVKANDANAIVKTYFDKKINPSNKMRYKVLMNVFVKILYIVVNIVAFAVTDGVFNGRFRTYGNEWIQWSKLGNEAAYTYMGDRTSPKPGNVLLPSFAICEVHESAVDIKHEILNKHKLVCEMSGHILYQYMLLIMWFCMVAGIVVSVLGLIVTIVDHIMTVCCFYRHGGSGARKVYKKVTIRECEYLEFIRRKNLSLYGDVIRQLKDSRFGPSENRHADVAMEPLYPTKKDME